MIRLILNILVETKLNYVNALYLVPTEGKTPGGYSQKTWVGVYGPLPKTLTLFMTKICDIPYPIYDLTRNSKPNL